MQQTYHTTHETLTTDFSNYLLETYKRDRNARNKDEENYRIWKQAQFPRYESRPTTTLSKESTSRQESNVQTPKSTQLQKLPTISPVHQNQRPISTADSYNSFDYNKKTQMMTVKELEDTTDTLKEELAITKRICDLNWAINNRIVRRPASSIPINNPLGISRRDVKPFPIPSAPIPLRKEIVAGKEIDHCNPLNNYTYKPVHELQDNMSHVIQPPYPQLTVVRGTPIPSNLLHI